MIGRRFRVYEVLQLIGAGGMGEVYRARDTRLGRDVAIKILPREFKGDPARVARFEREARALASLNHPHIGAIYGLEDADDVTALVMELVEGEDLSARVARGPLPIDEALSVARQIADALDAAHEQGIIHRDLKPANIRVQRDGTVKVLDFGLAKSVSTSAPGEMSTRTATSFPGAIIGTPAYMSPEQARGEETGRETDVWAFGVVFYELLSGVSPFARPTTAETLAQVLTAPPDEALLPANTPARVRRLVRRCLEKDPKRRWRHVGDLRIEIEDALTAPAADTTSNTGAIHAPVVPRRRALLSYGAASLALLASGIGGGVLLDRRFRTVMSPEFRRLTFRRGLIRSARFAPDGQTIVYGALWDGDRCRVHTVRVDGPESRPLDLPDANVLAISRSGELAISLGSHLAGTVTYGTLARVPMAGGVPRQMIEDVKFADWSPDGTDLAVVRRVDARDRLEFPVGKVLVQPGPGEHTGLGFARISPDGKLVAFVHYRAPGALGGRVSAVDQAGNISVLSDEYLNVHGLTWKGNEIWYTAADQQPLSRALCAVKLNGERRVITRMPGNITLWDALPEGRLVLAHTDDHAVMVGQVLGSTDRNLSWLDSSWVADISGDSRLLLFYEIGPGGGPQGAVYLRGMDGSPAIRLGAGRAFALSPDSRWALSASAALPSRYLEMLPTGAGDPRRLADNGLAYTGARWLRDGKTLVVQAIETGHQSRLYRLDLPEGRPSPLTPEGVTAWAVSPDGLTIAARGPGPRISLYGVDGRPLGEVPGLTGPEVPIGWIADGLLVTRTGDAASPYGEIYCIHTKTGRQDSWTNILPRDRAGILALVAFRVTPDGRSLAYSWHRALSSLYVAEGLS